MRLIDRTTTHTCSGLEADLAYFAAQGRDLFRCAGEDHVITVHYAQFPMICADCRRECLDESDVAPEACAWCGATASVQAQITPEETHPVNQTPIAGYGRHNEITIVRHDGSRRSDRFYTLVDRNNRPIGRPWTFLRNARKQAEIRARFLAQGDETGLAVLGMTLEGLAR